MNNIKLINFVDLNIKEIKLVLSWRNHPTIKEWMYNNEIITFEEHLNYIENLENTTNKSYFLIKQNQSYIGVIDFIDIDRSQDSVKFGLYSNINVKGMGVLLLEIIKDYAFNHLKINTLIAEVLEENKKAIELYKKFHFLGIGTKIKHNKKILCLELKNNKTTITTEKKKILIIAAHPDDEVLGCFGTVARLIQEGYEAYTLILGEGKTSRDEKRVIKDREVDIKILNNEIQKANDIIGIKEIFIESFPDNRFDSVDLLDIIKVISKIKNKIKPDIIFTHFENDLNIDHQITYQAVLTATRPVNGETVKEIYSFEVLSSTEWNYPLSFIPDTFFDISETMDLKLNAMKEYSSELCEYPHPRSLKGIKLNANYQGMRVGKQYVEAFKSIRVIK